MLGRLHEGFTVTLDKAAYSGPEYEQDDVLLFYLAIADGWRDKELLEVNGDEYKGHIYTGPDRYGNWVTKHPSEMRQIVAKKAFDMLAQNYFRIEEKNVELLGEKRRGQNDHIIASERLFKALVGFFAVQKGPYSFSSLGIRNLTTYRFETSHYQSVTEDFLLSLVLSIWRWQEVEIRDWYSQDDREMIVVKNETTRKMLEEAKPWAIEVLNIFRKLHVIDGRVSPADLDKIREIAMRAELVSNNLVSKKRPVVTVEEAFVVGSHAASFLVMHEVMRHEVERLRGVLEADEAFQEAKRKEAEREEAIRKAEEDRNEAQRRLEALKVSKE